MKKLTLITTFLALGAYGVLAQGVVNFSNFPSSYTDGIDRFVYESEGVRIANNAWRAQLMQDVGGTWTAIGAAQTFFGSSLPGVWSFQNRTLTGGGVGMPMNLQVAVWDSRTGADYASASLKGLSEVFVYTQAQSTPAAPADTLMHNFRAFVVPEPSTIALGVLGIGALLLFRRRK